MRYIRIILVVSIILNVILFNETRKSERSYNRPFVESFLLGGQHKSYEEDGFGEDLLFRVLLLDHLNSGFFQPLSGEFHEACVAKLLLVMNSEEIAQKFDMLLADVDHIGLVNGVFRANGDVRFTVVGNTNYVKRDYKGEECKTVIEIIKKDFMKYLGIVK